MGQLLGALGLNDSEREYVNVVGQSVVYDAIKSITDRYNADMATATSIFVSETTEEYKMRYKLAGGGTMQRLTGNAARPMAVKPTGSWDVAFPLDGFGDQIAEGRIDYAYMLINELDAAITSIQLRATNTRRYEILKRLFKNTQTDFLDPRKGSLAVQGLANGDSVLYPPTLVNESEATDNHYLASGYASSSISDTNNPFKVMVREVEEHFGFAAGGRNFLVFTNSTQTDKIMGLTDFNDVPDSYLRMGANADVPTGFPRIPNSSKLIGRTDSGCWVAEWDIAVPDGYMVGVHLEAEPPLKERVDPADTGLARGLELISESSEHPLTNSFWSLRFGYGAANRLNGVVMQMTTGSYAIPTAYQ